MQATAELDSNGLRLRGMFTVRGGAMKYNKFPSYVYRYDAAALRQQQEVERRDRVRALAQQMKEACENAAKSELRF